MQLRFDKRAQGILQCFTGTVKVAHQLVSCGRATGDIGLSHFVANVEIGAKTDPDGLHFLQSLRVVFGGVHLPEAVCLLHEIVMSLLCLLNAVVQTVQSTGRRDVRKILLHLNDVFLHVFRQHGVDDTFVPGLFYRIVDVSDDHPQPDAKSGGRQQRQRDQENQFLAEFHLYSHPCL
ncbi:MAG: hypothetical protein AW09_003908 [Candidatus Accumulibacter phosphatis]|uniref:Uncharacterized protein n=1 Tax=Candidatus Accumulibacter phosphatis TaxID=327160 RepID=A0A080LRV2_9PROT|nr:MAG: hypothetical protein AW09_003908 [Candidatus Accumulibacter phosphatis]